MKKPIALILAVILVSSLGTSAALAAKPGATDSEFKGNGAPSGAHYNLNIIGVPKEKSKDMTGSNGHVIFVNLEGKTRIMLSEGDYKVLDANGTDGQAAFQLPNPDPDNDGVTEYSVYVRALGKPNKSVTITPGSFTDEQGNTWIMSSISLELERKPGKNSFVNASKELLYVWVDLDDDGKLEHINLFNSDYYGYFWDYDNNGCKLVQMRFYEIPTTVPDEITPIL